MIVRTALNSRMSACRQSAGRARPHLLLGLLLAGVFFVTFLARIAWVANEQLELAHQYQQRGDTHRAIINYERAIHAYVPGLSSRKAAMRDMQSLLESLEAGNGALALEGWRRLRSAILYTRSMFGQPDREVLGRASHRIAKLAASLDKQGRMAAGDIESEALRLLSDPPSGVHAGWGVAQFLAILVWVISSGALIWHWQQWRPGLRWRCAGLSLSSYLFWLLALYSAG